MDNSQSDVLVGGYKPEDIQKKYLLKKEREEAEKRRQEGSGIAKPSKRTSAPLAGPTPASLPTINDLEARIVGLPDGGWRMSPIALRGGYYQYDLQLDLLDGGNEKSFDEWIEYSEKAYAKGDPVAASGDVLFAILDFLYTYRGDDQLGDQALPAWNFLKDVFNKERKTGNHPFHNRPYLLSKAVYAGNALGEDTCAHDLRLPTTIIYRPSILWGRDGFVRGLKGGNELCRLALGCPNPKHVHAVFRALTGYNPRACRITVPQSSRLDIPLVVGYRAGDFEIDVYHGGNDPRPAIGVARRAVVSETV